MPAAGDGLFDATKELAAGDDAAVQYVAKARLGLRDVMLMRRPRPRDYNRDDAFGAFLRNARRYGLTQLRDGQPIDAFEKRYVESHGRN